MPTLRLKAPYAVNSDLIISPAELLEMYFFGTPPRKSDGETMSEETIRHYIQSAQEQIENYLSLRFRKQTIEESADYSAADYASWGYVRTVYPIRRVRKLIGVYGDMKQVEYPFTWLSVPKPPNNAYSRHFNLMPSASNGLASNSVVYSGTLPLGFRSNSQMPNYWQITYDTGFDVVPEQIVKVVAQFAAVGIFLILGDLILGAGVASQSLSIDGLSQSISSTSSATNSGYGSRVIELRKNIETELEALKDMYVGIRFASC
jgi:hypothetical protein